MILSAGRRLRRYCGAGAPSHCGCNRDAGKRALRPRSRRRSAERVPATLPSAEGREPSRALRGSLQRRDRTSAAATSRKQRWTLTQASRLALWADGACRARRTLTLSLRSTRPRTRIHGLDIHRRVHGEVAKERALGGSRRSRRCEHTPLSSTCCCAPERAQFGAVFFFFDVRGARPRHAAVIFGGGAVHSGPRLLASSSRDVLGGSTSAPWGWPASAHRRASCDSIRQSFNFHAAGAYPADAGVSRTSSSRRCRGAAHR